MTDCDFPFAACSHHAGTRMVSLHDARLNGKSLKTQRYSSLPGELKAHLGRQHSVLVLFPQFSTCVVIRFKCTTPLDTAIFPSRRVRITPGQGWYLSTTQG